MKYRANNIKKYFGIPYTLATRVSNTKEIVDKTFFFSFTDNKTLAAVKFYKIKILTEHINFNIVFSCFAKL